MSSEYQKRKQKINEMHQILEECKRNGGLAQYGEKGALEIILKYVFKKNNYDELSAELLKQFGSIRGVLSADIDELYAVDGLGVASSRHFCYIGDIIRIEYGEKPTEKSFITLDSSAEFCIRALGAYVKESMFIAYIDSQFHLILMEEVFKKISTFTTFDIRSVVQMALHLKAEKILITHNHPNRLPMPSSQDIVSTRRIAFLLGELGIDMIDHIIVSGTSFYSFRKLGYFDELLD